jgi:membrane fusion protein (multidrug efflux system)
MLRKILISALALIIVLGAFAISSMMGTDEEIEQKKKDFNVVKYVFADTVEYSQYPAIVNAYGTVEPKNKISVFAEVPGIMLAGKKEFEVGNYFSKGETLLKLDDREITLQILSAKSDLITAITNLLPDLKSDYQASFNNWKNYLDNFELEGKIKDIPDFANDKEKYFLSNRGVLKLFYNIKNLELRKDKYTIAAPFDGAVTESLVNYGTLVSPGQRLGTFSGKNNFEVRLSILQNDIPFINIGNKVRFFSKTTDLEWFGTITRISDYIDPATQSVTAFAVVSGNGLKDGLYVNAEITGSELEQVFRIPRKSLYNNNSVYLIRDSVLDDAGVNVKKLSDDYAYINGLDSGLVIVKQALVNPELGMKVKPIKNGH